MPDLKVILHPTDFSEPAAIAHAAACDLAREYKARLIVLHVAEKPVVSYIEKATELSPEEFQQKLWETLQWPRECERALEVAHRVEEGNPVQQIVQMARTEGVDLIVMGTHGRHGMLKWFSSSITDQVVRYAPCSVLIARRPPENEGASQTV
ncbi:MAG TPA: universal stress protein [Phycisphaerae bacterium]|nr:universal stress protein [Phycisphaerae bacterium]